MGQIGLVTDVVEVDQATWIASAGTKLSCVSEFPGEETKYLTGTVDCQTSFKFGDVVKGDSETAVLVIRARFNGATTGVWLSVRCFADASDILTEIEDPVGTGTNAVDFNNEWCIVYKVIHPDVWAEFDPVSSGFSITKPDDGLGSTDIAWIRLLVPSTDAERHDPKLLMDVRACVTLATGLRQQEIDCACQLASGARFNLGSYDGSGMRISPNDTPASTVSWTNFDDVVDRIIAQQGISLLIIGTDTPNWAAWRTATGGDWDPGSDGRLEPNRPPPEAWRYWAADAQLAIDRLISKYQTAGLDPLYYCRFQIANEIGLGGAGGPWSSSGPYAYDAPYSALSDGDHDGPGTLNNRRNVSDQLAYLTSNVNFRGCRVLGTAHECDRDSAAFVNELGTMSELRSHLPIVTCPALNHYTNASFFNVMGKAEYVAHYYDSVMYCRQAIIDAVEGEIPGLHWDALPWALTEFGGTFTKMKMNGVELPQFGFSKKGEYLAAVADRLLGSGYFEIVSLYATRERSVVADSALFGLLKSDGIYTIAYRAFANRAGIVADTPPSGSYSTASGETAGIG